MYPCTKTTVMGASGGPTSSTFSRHAVVGPHQRRAVRTPGVVAERVVGAQLGVGHGRRSAAPGAGDVQPAPRDAGERHPGGRAGRGQADEGADDADGVRAGVRELRCAGHQTVPAVPT